MNHSGIGFLFLYFPSLSSLRRNKLNGKTLWQKLVVRRAYYRNPSKQCRQFAVPPLAINTTMLSPSKQKILVVGSGGIPKNSYPAFETINLRLNHSATSFAVYAPLVLPQPNVLIVSKKMPPPKKGGFDLGMTEPENLLQKAANKKSLLEGAGVKEVKSATENLFLHPIKVPVKYS